MDNQDHGKNPSSGHESHGVHLCHKCGWPFPNSHPSAKHRRSHKKICGTIKGYKLVDSGGSTHTTASDDEPHSDEDHKTPITQVPKVMGSGNFEESIGGIGEMSNRSEAGVFSDALLEFQDGGFGLGRQDSLDNSSKADQIAEKDLSATISSKDCENTDILLPPLNSSDRSQKENPLLESMPILSMGTPEHQDVGLSYSRDSKNRNDSASDVVPIEKETLMGVSEEIKEISAGVRECSVEQAADANENEEGKLNKDQSGGLILPSEHAGEISKTVSILDKRLDVTSDMVQFEEESSDGLASKASMSENVKQEIDGRENTVYHLERNLMDIVASNSKDAHITSEKTELMTSETVLADNIVGLEENSDKLALNLVIDDLSPKIESEKDMDSFQIQTDAAHSTDSSTAVDSDEVYEKKEKENESVYVLSVPDDIPVLDNAENKLEGFKDHRRVKLTQLEAFATEEIIIDKEDELRDCVSLDKSNSFLSNQLYEDINVDSSYMHVAEDSCKLSGNDEALVEEVLVEGKADVLQINEGSDALSSVDAYATENEKDQKLCSLEEQQPVNVADDLHFTGFSGSMVNDLPNVDPMVAHSDAETSKLDNVIGCDDKGISEKAGTGVYIAGGDSTRRIDDENQMKITVKSCESTNNSSLSQINPASIFLVGDSSDDIGTKKSEKSDASVVESGDGPKERYISIETNTTSESFSTHHQSPVVAVELNESEDPRLERVLNSQDEIKESEISRDHKVEECVNKDHIASVVENGGGHEFERTPENQSEKEHIHPPPYSELTSQNAAAVDDNHTRESGVAASGISSVILNSEADNGSVKPQVDTTVGDLSIESSSQTDSLEGHWGSVSVLSTQSDNPAVIDTEILPRAASHTFAEAEKPNVKKSKVSSEEQDFGKSDEFEAPSFMTLVERGSDEQKDSVSEIQLVQNAQNPRASPLQAGWFPSLSHVANESPGRKKNEEIIEKVTNWNAKQRTPLKNLLGEASSGTKPKSPNSKENPAVVNAREEKVAKDNVALATKGGSTRGPETPVAEQTNMKAAAGKEWNSPARYPVDIKREKRKVKGRPLWFVCCSSVN